MQVEGDVIGTLCDVRSMHMHVVKMHINNCMLRAVSSFGAVRTYHCSMLILLCFPKPFAAIHPWKNLPSTILYAHVTILRD